MEEPVPVKEDLEEGEKWGSHERPEERRKTGELVPAIRDSREKKKTEELAPVTVLLLFWFDC